MRALLVFGVFVMVVTLLVFISDVTNTTATQQRPKSSVATPVATRANPQSESYSTKDVAAAASTPKEKGVAGAPFDNNTATCFRRKIMFRVAWCPNPRLFLPPLIQFAAKAQRNNYYHIGDGDSGYRIAEVKQLLGDLNAPATLGKLLFEASTKAFCGLCCECAMVAPTEPTPEKVSHLYTAIVSERHATRLKALGKTVAFKPLLPPSPKDVCSPTVKTRLKAELATIDDASGAFLSVDTGSCDASVVDAVAEAIRGKFIGIQFTMVEVDANYEQLLAKLEGNGYGCSLPTQKVDHRKFRGIRTSQFPVFVQATKCWRQAYEVFKGSKSMIVCYDQASELAKVFGHMQRWMRHWGALGCGSRRAQVVADFAAARNLSIPLAKSLG